MKEYSKCNICERPFWVKDLKRVAFVDPMHESLKAEFFICNECKRKLDAANDPYAIMICDGPVV
jgi:uncharacterized protein with PIN domain